MNGRAKVGNNFQDARTYYNSVAAVREPCRQLVVSRHDVCVVSLYRPSTSSRTPRFHAVSGLPEHRYSQSSRTTTVPQCDRFAYSDVASDIPTAGTNTCFQDPLGLVSSGRRTC